MDDDTENDNDDVTVEGDEVEEAAVDVDEDVEVEERLEVDEEGDVHEEVAVSEGDDETTVVDEDTDVETESTKQRAVDGFDQGVVDLLSWILDTETRARIYVHLRKNPGSTSEEIAGGTGLYPSTVREALAELHEEEIVNRRKRESDGAGNNPYEYTAIAPSDLVGGIVGQVQSELNTVFNLDDYLSETESVLDEEAEDPVTITVKDDRDSDTEESRDDDAET
ncbi:winged helix-turn-helix transcriptional regulator [Halostella sp. PRR32]|uniref:winged helix-turn-helix transcriptional regulator n=1 Tax=Halostella sp. PRR32 TaxID=3098147 RepID=UPI002B1DB7BC|nr:winged helix-turn-helix transcriptional regulator [Halostella sp. PRR32]